MRKEVIGAATLFLADSEDVALWPTDAAVVTDPPYGIGYKSGPNSSSSISTTGKRFERRIRGDDKPFDPAHLFSMGFPAYAMTGAQHYVARLPATGSFHVWNKRGPYEPIDQADGDLIWVSEPQPLRIFTGVWRGLCRTLEHNEPILHPTQKPVALMAWMIGLLPSTDCVLDPYMGSGSTGLAALQMGKRFVGYEAEADYFDIACRRIEDAQRQSRMFA